MRRYFFHIAGPVFIHEYGGTELRPEAAARQRAIEDILRGSKKFSETLSFPARLRRGVFSN